MSVELQSIAFDPNDAKAALGQLPPSPAVFAYTEQRQRTSHTSGRSPNLRGRLEGCCSPRRGIRDGCNWLDGCGASHFGSPVRISNHFYSSFHCLRRCMGRRLWSVCICALRHLCVISGAIPIRELWLRTNPASAKPTGPTGRLRRGRRLSDLRKRH